ncbi:MAG: Hpt domain-containing protein, partial [Gammaproteobacteria bacterium]|nr:Hpt domain-containing protein [Gammaproteobacteria bacterium]
EAAFPEMLEAFLSDVPERIAAMRAAVAAGDREALRDAVHATKGGSGSIGAMRLSLMCRQLEERLRHGESIDISSAIADIEAEFAAAAAALAAYREADEVRPLAPG